MTEKKETDMKKWQIGIAGAPHYARQSVDHPRMELAALCNIDEEALARDGARFGVPDSGLFTDYEDFVNASTDIVVIATPIPYHADQVIKAMENGKHVLSEVTAAYTIEDCEAIVEAAKRTGQTYMMGENYCYFHYIREWKKIIEQGRLGKIFYAEGEYVHELHTRILDQKTGAMYWRVNRPPIYYCSHSLGPLLYLMDDRVVKATGAHSGYNIFPALGPGCIDMEVALFKTQKGAVIKILRSSMAYHEPPVVFYSLHGTKGFIENDRGRERKGKLYITGEMPRRPGYEVLDCPTVDPNAPPEARESGHGTSEYYLIRDFLEAVENGARPPIDAVRAMDFTLPGICAHEAAMSDGKWVDVPLLGW
jgi:predicted dehydrogenase